MFDSSFGRSRWFSSTPLHYERNHSEGTREAKNAANDLLYTAKLHSDRKQDAVAKKTGVAMVSVVPPPGVSQPEAGSRWSCYARVSRPRTRARPKVSFLRSEFREQECPPGPGQRWAQETFGRVLRRGRETTAVKILPMSEEVRFPLFSRGFLDLGRNRGRRMNSASDGL
jgi:hypothetical protein